MTDQTTATGQIRDVAELWKAVEASAGVSLGDVPILTKYLWFPTPQSGGTLPTIIEMGSSDGAEPAEIPVKPGFIVFGMFQDTDEIRVYALAKATKDANGRPNPPHRLSLSKHAPIIGVEIMALEVFIDEVANELREASSSTSDEIAALEAENDALKAALDPKTVARILAELEQELPPNGQTAVQQG